MDPAHACRMAAVPRRRVAGRELSNTDGIGVVDKAVVVPYTFVNDFNRGFEVFNSKSLSPRPPARHIGHPEGWERRLPPWAIRRSMGP